MDLQDMIKNSEIRVSRDNNTYTVQEGYTMAIHGSGIGSPASASGSSVGIANASGYDPTDTLPVRIIEDGNYGGIYRDGHKVSGIEKNGTGVMAFDDVMAGIYRDGHKFDDVMAGKAALAVLSARKTLMPLDKRGWN